MPDYKLPGGTDNGDVAILTRIAGSLETLRKWLDDNFADFIISGLTAPTSANLTHTIALGVATVQGYRMETPATARTYTASKDTYVDLKYDAATPTGVFTFVEVANGAAEPAVTANSLRIFKVVTSGTAITSVIERASRGFLSLYTQTIDIPAASPATIAANTSTDINISTPANTVQPGNLAILIGQNSGDAGLTHGLVFQSVYKIGVKDQITIRVSNLTGSAIGAYAINLNFLIVRL